MPDDLTLPPGSSGPIIAGLKRVGEYTPLGVSIGPPRRSGPKVYRRDRGPASHHSAEPPPMITGGTAAYHPSLIPPSDEEPAGVVLVALGVPVTARRDLTNLWPSVTYTGLKGGKKITDKSGRWEANAQPQTTGGDWRSHSTINLKRGETVNLDLAVHHAEDQWCYALDQENWIAPVAYGTNDLRLPSMQLEPTGSYATVSVTLRADNRRRPAQFQLRLLRVADEWHLRPFQAA